MLLKNMLLKSPYLKVLMSKYFFFSGKGRAADNNRSTLIWNPDIHWKQLPTFYLIFATLVALVGYYFILLFPTLCLVSVYNAFVLFPYHSSSDSMATLTLLWITSSMFFGHISYNILTIDFATIPGLKIKRKSADLLYKLLDDIHQEYPQAKIKKIIITENFELKVIKVPCFGIPIFSRNVLLVGLPLMLTLSPNQFNCLCTREIIHNSGKNRPFTATWLNQLRDSWDRYLTVLKPHSCIGHQLLFWFFSIYSPLYKAITLPARLVDELNSDRNALDLINSDELLNAFQASLRANIYLRKDFWPRIQNAFVNTEAGLYPFSTLSRTAKATLLQNSSNDWLQKQFISEECAIRQHPTLKQRMENLGLSVATLPPDLIQTAAEYYFHNHFAKIVVMTDENWREKHRQFVKAERTAGLSHKIFKFSVEKSGEMSKDSKAKIV